MGDEGRGKRDRRETEKEERRNKSQDGKDAGNEEGVRRGLHNQDSTTVCKRPSPAVSEQEEAACAPCGLGAGGGGGGAQGPWPRRPGDEEEEEVALEGVLKAESRGCLSSRVSFPWVGA